MTKEFLTDLPDELFCSEILARLPLKDAVRFSGVSRNWCRSWTRLPHLKFSDEFLNSISTSSSKGDFLSKLTRVDKTVDIINKIILMQCATLESFELHNCESFGNNIHKWLLWISSCNVKIMNLKCGGFRRNGVSESFYLCVTLSSLSLRNFRVTEIPATFKGFPRLVTCHLELVDLSDKAVEAILLSCPLLESLTLSKCTLPSKLRILSSSLKSLAVLPLGHEVCSIEAICPRLESIQILPMLCKLLNVNLCFPACIHLGTDSGLLQHFVKVKSLRKITLFNKLRSTDLGHLQSFPCLEELCVDFHTFADYPKVAAEFTLRLPNLKIFSMNVCFYDRYAVPLCSWILKGAPHLKTVIIGGIGFYCKLARNGSNRALEVANDFLSLASAFPKTKISLCHEVNVNAIAR